jgi:hypothetical protein
MHAVHAGNRHYKPLHMTAIPGMTDYGNGSSCTNLTVIIFYLSESDHYDYHML